MLENSTLPFKSMRITAVSLALALALAFTAASCNKQQETADKKSTATAGIVPLRVELQ